MDTELFIGRINYKPASLSFPSCHNNKHVQVNNFTSITLRYSVSLQLSKFSNSPHTKFFQFPVGLFLLSVETIAAAAMPIKALTRSSLHTVPVQQSQAEHISSSPPAQGSHVQSYRRGGLSFHQGCRQSIAESVCQQSVSLSLAFMYFSISDEISSGTTNSHRKLRTEDGKTKQVVVLHSPGT